MSSASAFDLDAYLTRVGYDGPRTVTLETLSAIQTCHSASIPFENLDVLLGRGIRIDLPSIEQKLIRDRRGGYCFEQNHLLAAALQAVGFAVTPLIARVRWQVPEDVMTGLTHMLLRIDLDGRAFLADVGFGSMSFSRPLALEFDREQSASLEPRRLVQRGPLVAHQARIGDAWSDVYVFRLEPAARIDFEMGNWYTSLHPQSRFVQNLAVARMTTERRHALLNREFTTRYADGRSEKRTIDSPDELLSVLAEHFGLVFPPGTRFGKPGSAWPS